MEFPVELRMKIEQLISEQDLKKMTASAEVISKRYRSESGAGKRLVTDSRDTLAYAAVRMPATFGAVSRALELTFEHFSDDIGSILDVGAGTGAASHAAELITECGDITCLEREQGMIDLGKELMKSRGIKASWIKRDISEGDIAEKADLVLSSYCLNELSPSARKTALQKLWRAADKLLVIIEPGTPEGFSQLREARKLLIAEGAHIVSPCPHSGECGIESGDWCHFTARIARSRLHKQLKGADVPYEDEKFCFIAVARQPQDIASARVLRHPKIESGKITLQLCTEVGICDRIITKKSPLFKAARKSDSGDSFAAE